MPVVSIADWWLCHEKTAVRCVLLAASIISLALAVTSVRGDSATSDEPAHIVNGLIKLRYGDFDFFREQPPLGNSLSALPLAIAGAKLDGLWRVERDNHWRVGFHLLYESGNDADTMLLLARLPTIALFSDSVS